MTAPKPSDLTAERLRQVLHYDPDTGVFTWLINRKGHARIGGVAGSKNDEGYLLITVDGGTHRAHRLAWLYMTGNWPVHQLDHRTKGFANRADNRFANLRQASNKENNENRVIYPRNSSGFRGVSWDKARGNWHAHITHNYKMIALGRYACLIDAVAARIAAERQFFTHSELNATTSRDT